MKQNFFGDPILQPGDDVLAAFMDNFEADDDVGLVASDIEDDPEFGWSCLITSDDGDEMQAHDFEDEVDLRAWLTRQGVEIDD